MNKSQKKELRSASVRWLLIATVILTSCALLSASSGGGKIIANNTPRYVNTAKNLGAADPAQTIEVSIWLNMHNRSALDALTKSLYDKSSPNYRHWLTSKDLAARFMPTAAEAKVVQNFFKAHNLKVVTVGSNSFFVRASGTVGDVEKAFHVQLNNYEVSGKTLRANDRDPVIDDGATAGLTAAVSGLDSGQFEHPLMQRSIPTGKPAAVPAGIRPEDIYSNVCFPGTETDVFSTNNNGTLPIGTYKGNYIALQNLTSSGCAYTPPMIQAAYNLNGLYAEGYMGQGQTIGIIDWCGSNTIQSDANAFSAQYGLPALTSSNFTITYTPRPSLCISADQVEINIDVEWAHAIAPGANINLIVPPTNSFQDIDQAEYNAIDSGLANVLSGSYGAPEAFVSTTELQNGNLISQIAASMGISTNFSTGDCGDNLACYGETTLSYPADAPYATGIGGVTLALNADNSIAWQAGWGNNQIELYFEGAVADPPSEGAFGFTGGSGGGPSGYFSKPAYQKKLPGKFRQLPDFSWLADPYTGAAILISVPGDNPLQTWQVWGGTSVACPMFSALWAIANQEAEAGGSAALGQAAPYMYSLPTGTVYDIVPVSSKTNVTGSIQDSSGTTAYNANAVVGGDAPAKFVSAIWDYPWEPITVVETFGTDCDTYTGYASFETACTSATALRTKPGWDNVTGVGTPNAQAFADSFYGK